MKKLLLVISCIILLTTLAIATSGNWDIPNFWTKSGNTISTIYDVLIENMTITNVNVTNHEVNGTLTSSDWSNVTITESQISNLDHTNLTEFDVEQYIFDDGINCGNLTGNTSDLCSLIDTNSSCTGGVCDDIIYYGDYLNVLSFSYARGVNDAQTNNFAANGYTRWNVTATNFNTTYTVLANLFNGNFDDWNKGWMINTGVNSSLSINITDKGEYPNNRGLLYPTGFILVNFYHKNCPDDIGGHLIDRLGVVYPFTNIENIAVQEDRCQYKFVIPPSPIKLTDVQIDIVGKHTTGSYDTIVAELEWYMGRPFENGTITSFFNAYRINYVYNDFSFKGSDNEQTMLLEPRTGNIVTSGNITLGQRITFALGGAIDYVTNLFTFNDNVLIDGDLNVTGNVTGNFIYGEMHFHNDSVGNLTELDQDVWNNITAFDQGYSGQFLNGISYSESVLTILTPGVYDSAYSITFSGTVNNKYHTAIGINGDPTFNTESHDRISTGSDILSSSGVGYLRLSMGDEITLMVQNENSGGDSTTLSANINLERIGE